jgi:hypothetical protein
MDLELKVALGKILAENYKVQIKLGMGCPGSAVIYGLENGIEDAIDSELGCKSGISEEKHNALAIILDEVDADKKKLEAFKGYYDIERQIQNAGISRGEAMRLLTYFLAKGQFIETIKKMDSSSSPIECRTFRSPKY